MKSAGHKVLVIDDDKSIRTFVSEGLFLEGYDAYTAENGKRGIDMVIKERPDLIILDVEMPELNGWETLKKLREIPRTQDIPVLMLTGRGHPRDMGKAAELGATGYLIKPVDIEQLFVRITSILHRRLPLEKKRV